MEDNKRITVKDIANELQISPGTVSKALSGKRGISEAMRSRIYDTAVSMGYRVNRTAQCLARKPIRIGITYPAVWAQYYDELIHGMERALDSLRDFNVIGEFKTFSSLYSMDELSDIVHQYIDEQVDAVILCPASITTCDVLLQELKSHNIPVFLVGNDFYPDLRTDCIRVNAILAGKLAGELMNYLTEENANLLAFIGDKSLTEHAEKITGFCSELQGGRRLVSCFETQDEPQVAAYLIQKSIQEIHNIQGVYVATGNSISICDVLSQNEATRSIKLIVTDWFDDLIPYVHQHRIHAVVFQNPAAQGEIAIRRCYDYLTKHTLTSQHLITPTVLLRNNLLEMEHLEKNQFSSSDVVCPYDTLK